VRRRGGDALRRTVEAESSNFSLLERPIREAVAPQKSQMRELEAQRGLKMENGRPKNICAFCVLLCDFCGQSFT
jgi:hypothetical protein